MTNSPVVLVSRTPDGYASRAVWFENEAAYYDDAPTLLMEFNRERHAWSYTPLRTSSRRLGLRAAHVMGRLERTPWTAMAFAETHWVPEPGAPLEPVPEVAA